MNVTAGTVELELEKSSHSLAEKKERIVSLKLKS